MKLKNLNPEDMPKDERLARGIVFGKLSIHVTRAEKAMLRAGLSGYLPMCDKRICGIIERVSDQIESKTDRN